MVSSFFAAIYVTTYLLTNHLIICLTLDYVTSPSIQMDKKEIAIQYKGRRKKNSLNILRQNSQIKRTLNLLMIKLT